MTIGYICSETLLGKLTFLVLSFLVFLIKICIMSAPVTGKPQLNRVVNRTLILDRIRREGEISRADLAKTTAIRPPTVSSVIRDLIAEGLVEERGNGESKGGRAPRMVALVRKQPRAIGFEVTETTIRAGVCDLQGELVARTRCAFAPASPEETLERLFAVGEGLLGAAGLTWAKLYGVGVGVQGHMDMGNGVVRWSHPFGWRDVPFRRMCESRWGTCTDVMNDCAAGSMAAHFIEVGREVRNLVYLCVRFADASHGVVGLGSGIIVNGEPYHGEFGAAGEITSPVAHPLTYAVDEAGRPYADPIALAEAVGAGVPSALRAMDRLGEEMASLVIHAVNLLEPGILVIGADIAELEFAMLSRVKAVLRDHSLRYEAGQTRVIASPLGEFGIVRGAVVPTLQRIFSLPRWT